MHKLILIETSTELCSTALSDGDRIICERLSTEPRAHAAMTAVFVKEMLDGRGLKVKDCDAVCVSMKHNPGKLMLKDICKQFFVHHATFFTTMLTRVMVPAPPV